MFAEHLAELSHITGPNLGEGGEGGRPPGPDPAQDPATCGQVGNPADALFAIVHTHELRSHVLSCFFVSIQCS